MDFGQFESAFPPRPLPSISEMEGREKIMGDTLTQGDPRDAQLPWAEVR